jgi:putative SOS response-associated peptidase YedK
MTLTRSGIAEVVEELDAEISPDDAALYRGRYNVAPSDLHWILEYGADRRVLRPAFWGYRAAGRPLINVRGEQLIAGSGFKEAFRSRRCLVVTDGFYEWTPQKAPVWYHRGDGGLLLLAGLYQTADALVAAAHPRFTVLTTRANNLVSRVHSRMPVVLSADHVDDWLTVAPAEAAAFIVPASDDALVATPVSKRVNSVRHDDPACLAPPGEGATTPDDPQRRLF